MTPRCASFVQLKAAVARLEREAVELKKSLGEKRKELREVAKKLTPSEQDWLKRFLAEEAER